MQPSISAMSFVSAGEVGAVAVLAKLFGWSSAIELDTDAAIHQRDEVVRVAGSVL
jgi:hypothetical protein